MREVIVIVGCGGDLIHSPVDSDDPSVLGEWLVFHRNDEARPPMVDFVLVDPQLSLETPKPTSKLDAI